MGQSTSHPMSCSHHSINLFVPRIQYSPPHILYMGWKSTCDATVSCLLCIYSLFVQNAKVSSASVTEGHFHSLPVVCCSVIPIIILATQQWETSSTLVISPTTTQLSLPYSNTNCHLSVQYYMELFGLYVCQGTQCARIVKVNWFDFTVISQRVIFG